MAKREQDTHSIMLVSYFPLLYGNPLQTPELTKELAKEMCDHLESLPPSGADGCLWTVDATAKTAAAIFLYDRAEERATHLKWWAGDQPEKWFKVTIYENKHGYGIVMMPDPDKSHNRNHYYRSEFCEGVAKNKKDEKVTMLFSPPYVVCPSKNTYGQVRKLIKNKLKIGFIEKKHANERFAEFVYWLGEFDIDQSGQKFLDGNLKSMGESNE